MTKEDAIKYLQQLYPHGGYSWLDEQRIEAIGMAVNALQELKDKCQGCNNVKGCITCVDGSEWAHIEECVSIDFEQELYKAFGQVKDFTLGMRIAKRFYDMGKNSQERVSEEFEEALAQEWKGYNDRGAATVDALEDNTQELAFAKGFYHGWHLGKEEPVSTDFEEVSKEPRIWVARNHPNNGALGLYNGKPIRTRYCWEPTGEMKFLERQWFPEVTWENSPKELVIKDKESVSEGLEEALAYVEQLKKKYYEFT